MGGDTAGQGGTGPVSCTSTTPSGNASFVDEEAGSRPQGMFLVPVSVVSVADCATGACGVTSTYTRIVLSEAGGRRWTLGANYPGLPADIVDVGEALDLFFTDHDGVSATTILSRAGTAIIFDVTWAGDLASYGIDVHESSAAGRCARNPCFDAVGATVTYGGETASVAPGQTVVIGKLSFSHGRFNEKPGDCTEPYPPESMAGFTVR